MQTGVYTQLYDLLASLLSSLPDYLKYFFYLPIYVQQILLTLIIAFGLPKLLDLIDKLKVRKKEFDDRL